MTVFLVITPCGVKS